MTGDSGEGSGSDQEVLFGPFVRVDLPLVAPTVSPTNHVAAIPEDPRAERSEALAMQSYRIDPGGQSRLMGVMGHHSMESAEIMREGESKSHKPKSKRRTAGQQGYRAVLMRGVWVSRFTL